MRACGVGGAAARSSGSSVRVSRTLTRPRTLKGPLYVGHRSIDTVVKLGGGLLAHEGSLDTVLNVHRRRRARRAAAHHPWWRALCRRRARSGCATDAHRRCGALDGGAGDGPVRASDRRRGCRGAVLVSDATEMSAALASRRIPVLAPYAWLRRADPLPHSWEVTSDSIAAWIARAIGASRLVLVKPPGAEPASRYRGRLFRARPRNPWS